MRLPFFLIAAFALAFAACDSSEPEDSAASSVILASSNVTVAYEGRLTNGTVFDSSNRATFDVNRLIPGFQAGILGMAVGESRTFEVSPDQGYGNQQVGSIPPNSTLIFDVTLISIN